MCGPTLFLTGGVTLDQAVTVDVLGRPTLRVNEVNGTTVSDHARSYRADGQVERDAYTGTAFADLGGTGRNEYGHNTRGEVIWADRYLGGTISTNVFARDMSVGYQYDPIGNRVRDYRYYAGALDEVNFWDHYVYVSEYTANALNQYTNRTVPGMALVRGLAATNAAVTVNGQTAWRPTAVSNGYYSAALELGNTGQALYTTVVATAELVVSQRVLKGQSTGQVFVARTPEGFAHDADGNLTRDGRFEYSWDAENRLVEVYTRSDLPTNMPRLKVQYQYDPQGRRVARTQLALNGSAWQTNAFTRYIYDGWDLIAEMGSRSGVPAAFTNYYVWGLDVSGSMQGAGGIGGLLFRSGTGGSPVFYTYTHNGNVSELVDAQSGAIAAHYEYDPFGNVILMTGPAAKNNPFRFSTKYTDQETGLIDFGVRWYSPTLGRFLSTDPIEESAGANLYCFLQNDPIDALEVLGLYKWEKGNPCRIKIEKGDTLSGISKEIGVSVDTLKEKNGGSDKIKIGQVLTLGNLTFTKKYDITFYCNCKKCCDKEPTDPAYGICDDGSTAVEGTVAADWHKLPPNSKVKFTLDGSAFDGTVHDTGGKIKGNRIDVWCKDDAEAVTKGRKKNVNVDVELDCSKVP